jgi:hypothetical protein
MDDLFWQKVNQPSPDACWEWGGYRNPKGYGIVGRTGRTMMAHRVAYEATVGPIPEGMQIDHICRNRPCVNPSHLEVVTPGENTRRGWIVNRTPACPKGHIYTPETTYIGRRGERYCKICRREVDRRRRPALGRRGTAEVCRYGHRKEGGNLYVNPTTGQHVCVACRDPHNRVLASTGTA